MIMIGKSRELGEKSLFLDLLVHLREVVKSNMDEIQGMKDTKGQYSSGTPYTQINLVQSSVMCVDTLVRALARSSSWQAMVCVCMCW